MRTSYVSIIEEFRDLVNRVNVGATAYKTQFATGTDAERGGDKLIDLYRQCTAFRERLLVLRNLAQADANLVAEFKQQFADTGYSPVAQA